MQLFPVQSTALYRAALLWDSVSFGSRDLARGAVARSLDNGEALFSTVLL